ncbi:MAG: histone deacetylase family protein [Thermoanaerobaculia bacterium]
MVVTFTDRRCLGHDPIDFPERPARLAEILAGLGTAGAEVRESGEHPRTLAAIEAVHDPRYVARFRRAVERGDGLLDSADNPLTGKTWDAALAAAAVALSAADWMMEGDGRRAFAAVRPPGHHAERAMAMGFCYFNNVAVAAQHLRDRHGVERVAIFDFDVHHGNGTQHLFEERADVFFASTHQYPFYPGTGAAGEQGRGRGESFTLNVPLPAGTADASYQVALEERVLPAIRGFRPQVLLVSAGFDAWQGDPLGGLRLTEASFERLGRELGALADELCGGRVLSLLEGGYDLTSLPRLVTTYLESL